MIHCPLPVGAQGMWLTKRRTVSNDEGRTWQFDMASETVVRRWEEFAPDCWISTCASLLTNQEEA